MLRKTVYILVLSFLALPLLTYATIPDDAQTAIIKNIKLYGNQYRTEQGNYGYIDFSKFGIHKVYVGKRIYSVLFNELLSQGPYDPGTCGTLLKFFCSMQHYLMGVVAVDDGKWYLCEYKTINASFFPYADHVYSTTNIACIQVKPQKKQIDNMKIK